MKTLARLEGLPAIIPCDCRQPAPAGHQQPGQLAKRDPHRSCTEAGKPC